MKSKKWEVLHSSAKEDWGTPQDFFDKLNAEFNFTLDVCASEANAKCSNFFSLEFSENGLEIPWLINGGSVCWMNPPYGRKIGAWIKKAYEESQKGATVVALLPSRTGTRWYHTYIYNQPNVETRFIKGRLKFQGAPAPAPFDSLIVIFRPPAREGESK